MACTRPITPPSQTKALSPSIHNTPLNRGSGSNSAFHIKTKVSDYYSYLWEDLQNCATIEFEEFLEHILNFKLDPEAMAQVDRIVETKHFKKLMDKYSEPVSDESECYAPFSEMVNYGFDEIGLKDRWLCHNEGRLIWGSYAARKLDVLGVLTKAFGQGGRMNPDNLSKNGPEWIDAFHWGEVLDFWEFKLAVKSLTEYMKSKGSRKLSSKTVELTSKTNTPSEEQIPARASSSNSKSNNLLLPTRRSTRLATMRDTQEKDQDMKLYSSESQKKRSSSSNSEQVSKRTKVGIEIDESDLQCAGYALEMFSNGNLLNHIISYLITDFKIQL
ncbi:hypothetical protein BU17DRAFT_102611 [Hysterangium stoloniferum]|nr:hypothetical protein BU17DRAFT_102611 [Hysterangium stoloniferum]